MSSHLSFRLSFGRLRRDALAMTEVYHRQLDGGPVIAAASAPGREVASQVVKNGFLDERGADGRPSVQRSKSAPQRLDDHAAGGVGSEDNGYSS